MYNLGVKKTSLTLNLLLITKLNVDRGLVTTFYIENIFEYLPFFRPFEEFEKKEPQNKSYKGHR